MLAFFVIECKFLVSLLFASQNGVQDARFALDLINELCRAFLAANDTRAQVGWTSLIFLICKFGFNSLAHCVACVLLSVNTYCCLFS